MKRLMILFIVFAFLTGGCSAPDEPVLDEENIEEEDVLEGIKLGYPEDVVTAADDLVNTMIERSGVNFVFNSAAVHGIPDIGKVYSIMYFAIDPDNELSMKKEFRYKTTQLRICYDFNTHKLSAFCMINPTSPRDSLSDDYYNIFYNNLWSAYHSLDFETLFDNRPYEKADGSDDDTHSEDKFYIEYLIPYVIENNQIEPE